MRENLIYIEGEGLRSGIKESHNRRLKGHDYSAPGAYMLTIVAEGRMITRCVQTHERSSRLRKIAIDTFTHDNVISCDCCGFNFPTYYGPAYGVDCIEIHHIKPIFLYEGVSFEQTIENALQNLLPVCPNCHRVIHKNHIGANNIEIFKSEILARRAL